MWNAAKLSFTHICCVGTCSIRETTKLMNMRYPPKKILAKKPQYG